MSAYAASKAALVRLTENLAVDLRGTGIDVNAVALSHQPLPWHETAAKPPLNPTRHPRKPMEEYRAP